MAVSYFEEKKFQISRPAVYRQADPLSPILRVQELCESRGGRPGLPVLMSFTVSVDVKQH